MRKLLFPAIFVLVLIPRAGAQQFAFPESAIQDPATLSKAVVRLAGQALAVYKDDDRERYLSSLWALQAVAGRYPEAVRSLVAIAGLAVGAMVAPWVEQLRRRWERQCIDQEFCQFVIRHQYP
jgi:hypothetical protein